MIGVNFLDKLLDGLTIEWTALGHERFVEVANAARRPVKASLRVSGEVPYYGANNIQDYVDGYTHDGEYVLIAEDGSASLENYSVQHATGRFWANNHVHVVRGKYGLNTKFLYHYLRSVDFSPYLPNKDRAKLTKGEMVKIPLPIPCPDNIEKSLEIQAEIVRILDAFTELTTELSTELTAELTARKKQYNHYRDQLLSFEDGEVEWKSLRDVAEVRSGWGFPTAEQGRKDGEYPFYKVSDMNTAGNETMMTRANSYIDDEVAKRLGIRVAPPGTVIFPKIGAAVATNKKRLLSVASAYDNNVMGLIPGETISSRFLYYWMQTVNLSALANDSGAVPSIRKSEMEEMLVPVPCHEEQSRIVTIIEKFDALFQSIAESLPREIDLRQKQYAYYRDLLLSFPKPVEVEA